MGVIYSMCTILEGASGAETIVEEFPDEGKGGHPVKRTTVRKNPYIVALTTVTATVVLITYLDGGTGCITKTLGRKCIDCQIKRV